MGILTAVRDRADRRRERRRAKAAFVAAERTIGRHLNALTAISDPHQRAGHLYAAAEAATEQWRVHRLAFGPDPIPDEDGRDFADSIGHSALLLRLIADTEDAAAYRQPRRIITTMLEPAAGRVLDRMAATDDPAERGALLDDLYDAVVDTVGEQAAEAVHCLPAPGHERVRTFRQFVREIRAERRADPTPSRGWWLAAIASTVLTVASFPVDGVWGTALVLAGAAAYGVAALLWWRRSAS